MTSGDALRVEINGREYAVISGRLEAIERDNREIRAEIVQMDKKLDMLLVRVNGINERIEDMKFYMSMAFGAFAVFIGLSAIVPIAGKIWEKLTKPGISEEQMSRMIYEAVERALSARN